MPCLQAVLHSQRCYPSLLSVYRWFRAQLPFIQRAEDAVGSRSRVTERRNQEVAGEAFCCGICVRCPEAACWRAEQRGWGLLRFALLVFNVPVVWSVLFPRIYYSHLVCQILFPALFKGPILSRCSRFWCGRIGQSGKRR